MGITSPPAGQIVLIRPLGVFLRTIVLIDGQNLFHVSKRPGGDRSEVRVVVTHLIVELSEPRG